ncbi:MAG: Coenzyme F420 hydrogenase/dehydrogenase, beta subunit C-terminal domain [Oscillospiraceae bacterium]|jgi:coenzyme F420-reducing hydrogenase beta subunit
MSIRKLPGQTCTACGACVNACAFGAVQLVPDAEGFCAPELSDACVECGVCEQVCPQMREIPSIKWRKAAKGWLAVGMDGKLIQNSASGGAFATFADYVIESQNGVAFGAYMDQDFDVRHGCARSSAELAPMLGSKYVQSDIGLSHRACKRFLEDGRFVLYSGTPCQIAGLKGYLGRDYDKLITVDIVCHGVSSPLAFRSYIRWLSDRAKMRVVSYRFRNRTKYDRSGYISKTTFQDKRGRTKVLWRRAERDVYFKAYLDGELFRRSCYACSYAQEARVSDITLGDCNSYSRYKDFHPYEASSIVLLNSPAGEGFWDAVSCRFHRTPLDVPGEMRANGQLHKPPALPDGRDAMCNSFSKGAFEIYEKECRKHMTTVRRLRSWAQLHVPLKLRMKISGGIRRLKRKTNHG